MGARINKQYQPLKHSDELIELETYSATPLTFRSASELSYHCQKLIILGYPLEAYNLIKSSATDTTLLYLPLHTQEFIELIHRKKHLEALSFAQKSLVHYKNSSFSVKVHKKTLEISVNDIMGLLCYENPENSPLSYLLDPAIKTFLAGLADSVINPQTPQKKICDKICCCRRRKRVTDMHVS